MMLADGFEPQLQPVLLDPGEQCYAVLRKLAFVERGLGFGKTEDAVERRFTCGERQAKSSRLGEFGNQPFDGLKPIAHEIRSRNIDDSAHFGTGKSAYRIDRHARDDAVCAENHRHLDVDRTVGIDDDDYKTAVSIDLLRTALDMFDMLRVIEVTVDDDAKPMGRRIATKIGKIPG